MLIAEMYVLQGGASFLNFHSSSLVHLLSLTVGVVRPRGAAYVGLVLEALLRRFPAEGGSLLVGGGAGVAEMMINSCGSNWTRNEESEPDRVVVIYLTAMARMLLGDPTALDGFFPAKVSDGKGGVVSFGHGDLVGMFLKLHLSLSGSHAPLHRKLWAMCLLSLLPPSQSPASPYGRPLGEGMDPLMELCLDVLREEKEPGCHPTPAPFSVGYDSEEETVDCGKGAYDAFIQREMQQDIAFTTNFEALFQAKMAAMSPEAKQNIQNIVEPTTLQHIEKVLS
mmetsp:Transcript_44834/g.136923  ORF Transcript_44834/g.136923 Transcript_44834/m.136923 type:complete len:281 (+) Transcript_44834:1461-2303(+)